MARKFGSLTPLRDVDADGESDAVARVIQSLVGGAAYLFELVAGHAVSNDSQVTPPNPQGEIGVDLSGPPWGSAIRHPIAWCGGMLANAAINYGPGSVIKVPPGTALSIVGPWRIWVRPFEHLPGESTAPYAIGEISLTGHEASAMAGVFLSVDIRNLSISSAPLTQEKAFQIDSGTTTEGTYTTGFTPTQPRVRLVPGWNTIEIGFSHDGTNDFYVDSIVINQIQKRTH